MNMFFDCPMFAMFLKALECSVYNIFFSPILIQMSWIFLLVFECANADHNFQSFTIIGGALYVFFNICTVIRDKNFPFSLLF